MKRIGLILAVLTVVMFLAHFAGRSARLSDARAEKKVKPVPPLASLILH